MLDLLALMVESHGNTVQPWSFIISHWKHSSLNLVYREFRNQSLTFLLWKLLKIPIQHEHLHPSIASIKVFEKWWYTNFISRDLLWSVFFFQHENVLRIVVSFPDSFGFGFLSPRDFLLPRISIRSFFDLFSFSTDNATSFSFLSKASIPDKVQIFFISVRPNVPLFQTFNCSTICNCFINE